ncbi:MAG TPA: TIGR03668 family PPOX class F420-dependent oxidoreductase [Jatrophihabitantaceae bacterium]|jgi:PPOX class probable F420-dependent enzyme
MVAHSWDALSGQDRDRLAAAQVARLATVRPDGTPHLVPITFAFVDGALVTAVDGKPKRTTQLQRLRNIRAHPVVSVLVDSYAPDWSQLWWIRIDGPAEIVAAGPACTHAIGALVAKYPQYRAAAPDGPVIRVQPTRITSWRASGW